MLRRRHRETLITNVKFIASNKRGRNIEVGCVLRADRNIHRDAAACTLDDLRRVETISLRRNEYACRFRARDQHDVRGIARRVRLLVSDNLNALLLRSGPKRTDTRGPEVRGVFHFAVLHRHRRDTHAELTGVGNRELNLPLAVGTGLSLRG